ncbi:MAG: hypothetical protein ACR2MU_00875 [Gaiellaceae bacterium]
MRPARLAAVVFALALVFAVPAQSSSHALAAPGALKAFLLRADEPTTHVFPRTPSFAWLPVPGSQRYEFELATSANFDDGSIVWNDATLKTPAASVPYSLPWLIGKPYALYSHVRAWTASGPGPWSTPFGFNMRWESLPASVPTYPGLVSWSIIPGATSYDVWYVDVNKVISTRTNAADEREYYDFHHGPDWTASIHWRVRAVRSLYGSTQGLPNGLPSVTYGPWSQTFTSTNPPVTAGPVKLTAALSDVASAPNVPQAHRLTPGFAFTGTQAIDGIAAELYRIYVFTDSDCVNVVFRGAIVGSPAYAPRLNGPLALPSTDTALTIARAGYLNDGDEPTSFLADQSQVRPTEQDLPLAAQPAQPTGSTATATTPASGTTTTPAPSTPSTPPADPGLTRDPATPTGLPTTPRPTGAPVDLLDSGWPNGRYYWTAVPVRLTPAPNVGTTLTSVAAAGATTIPIVSVAGFANGSTVLIGTGATQDSTTVVDVNGRTLTLSSPTRFAHTVADPVVNPNPSLEYHDMELPQDACASGRIGSFGKVSEPALAGTSSPFASGLAPNGRLISAVGTNPVFYGTPLVAWKPAIGADQYQVQWSQTKYPWNPVATKTTYATSALLDQSVAGKRTGLTPGTWYYRVRGIDFSLPGTARAMSWSAPIAFSVARPQFAVVKSTKK